MKKIILIISILLLIILICSVTIFVFAKNSSKDNKLTSKAEEEVEYLENKIIAMMNGLNKINFSNSIITEEKTKTKSENAQQGSNNQEQSSSNGSSQKESEGSSSDSQNKTENTSQETTEYEIRNNSILVNQDKTIDWDYIKSNTESIYSTWATATIDLHELNVNNQDILNFSNVLDQVTLSAKQEDKQSTINNLASLYAFLPDYREQISDDKQKINIDYTKACILNTYALAEQNKWDEMKFQTENAINYFSNIINSIENNNQKQNKISKIYVLLNELNKSIDVKDKDIFMIKYKNVMEELVNF